jgi:hypothetical protein
MTEGSRDNSANWAKPVDSLHIAHDLPEGAINLNVEGKRISGMTGGFGKMWQKTYRVRLEGARVTPEQVVKVWKERFPEFWQKGQHFFGPMASISPGDVALINVKTGGVKLSTGILVLYADDVSFSFMTPEGHMFTGMITFSARDVDGVTQAEIVALVRAQDPIYELGMMTIGSGAEDRQWLHVLRSLAAHFGSDAKPTLEKVCVDKKRQWKHFKNIRKSAAIRTVLYSLTKPVRRKTSANTTP